MNKAENFAQWMKTTVRSIHYANNEAMLKAFAKFEKPDLKKQNYKFNLK